MSTKAIILAAGRGTRLASTFQKPKCLLEIGGRRIIDHQVEALRQAGIADVLVVVGYQKELVKTELGARVRYRDYDAFEETNNLHTLWSVRDEWEGGFLCLFGDVLFDPTILADVVTCADQFCLAIDSTRVLAGTMRVKIDRARIVRVGSDVTMEEADGNFIGLAGISSDGARLLEREMGRLLRDHRQDYYTRAIDALAGQGVRVGYVEAGGRRWREVDTAEDLAQARHVFAN